MIAVDTSALMAILLDEPEAEACAEALATNDRIVISAAPACAISWVSGCSGLLQELSR